jgi:hypothetical protein
MLKPKIYEELAPTAHVANSVRSFVTPPPVANVPIKRKLFSLLVDAAGRATEDVRSGILFVP